MPAPTLNSSQFQTIKIILSYHRTFPQIIWQFGDGVEFWLWGLMLSWQQQFEGMFSRNLNFLGFFYIKLDCDAWDQVFWLP